MDLGYSVELGFEGMGGLPCSTRGNASSRDEGMQQVLRGGKAELLRVWRARVLGDPRIPQANQLPEPVLVDHMPTFIDRLAEGLERLGPDPEREGHEVGLGVTSKNHAENRSENRYDVMAALLEYTHLRMAILTICRETGTCIRDDERLYVHAAIDSAMAVVAAEMQTRALAFEERLIGIVSHDLRNPIGAILLAVCSLERSGRVLQDGRYEAMLGRIRRSAERAGRLLEDLLSFTEARVVGLPIHRRPVDLEEVAKPYIVDAEQAGRQVGFHVEGDVHGQWDPDRMGQVVQNLLSNAIQHGTPTGPIDVTLAGHDGLIVLKVENEGSLPPPRVFEAFERAGTGCSGKPKGVGLGLYIARHIVEGHGGSLDVGYASGRVIFTARVPRVVGGVEVG